MTSVTTQINEIISLLSIKLATGKRPITAAVNRDEDIIKLCFRKTEQEISNSFQVVFKKSSRSSDPKTNISLMKNDTRILKLEVKRNADVEKLAPRLLNTLFKHNL